MNCSRLSLRRWPFCAYSWSVLKISANRKSRLGGHRAALSATAGDDGRFRCIPVRKYEAIALPSWKRCSWRGRRHHRARHQRLLDDPHLIVARTATVTFNPAQNFYPHQLTFRLASSKTHYQTRRLPRRDSRRRPASLKNSIEIAQLRVPNSASG